MQTSIKTERTSIPSTTEPTEPTVPSMSKRLRPHQDPNHDQTLVHCPRCDSTHTKFCYYNNYSLSQPRYFCKSCRRYWTKGGTLRNIPVGGAASRKNKKLSSISTCTHQQLHHHRREQQPQQNSHCNKLAIFSDGNPISKNSIGLQLSYPESPEFSSYSSFMFENLTIDFMESGGVGGGDYEGGGDHFPAMVGSGGYGADSGNAHGLSPFGEMMSYYEKMMTLDDVKPKVFDLEWRDDQSDLFGSGGEINGSSEDLLGLLGSGR